jgi:hypothetical protein
MKNKIFLNRLKVIITWIFVIFLAAWLVFNWYGYFVISNEVSIIANYMGSGRFLIVLFSSALLSGIFYFAEEIIFDHIDSESIPWIVWFCSMAAYIMLLQSFISTLGGGFWWFFLSVPVGIIITALSIFYGVYKVGNH